MHTKAVAGLGLGLAALLAAPLAFSDHTRKPLIPESGTFSRAVSFRGTGNDDVRQGDVKQGDVRQGDVRQGDVRQKGEIRQVDYTEIQQKGSGLGEPRSAVLNPTDILLHFYAHQRDEVAELTAQRERFRTMNYDNADRLLTRMIDEHQGMVTRTSSLLRDQFSASLDMAPPASKPFVSDSAIEMIDRDIQMHDRAVRTGREHMAMLRMARARDLLQDGIVGAQKHLTWLRQLRADIQAGRRSGEIVNPATLPGGGIEPGSAKGKGEEKGEEKGAPPFIEQGFTSEVPGMLEAEVVTIEAPPPPPPVVQPPPPPPPVVVAPPPPPAVVQAPRPPRRRPAH
jgi:hypothetical protein